MNKIKNLLKLLREYPYSTLSGKFFALDYLLLRLFPVWSFPKLSIVPFVIEAYDLGSEEEFRVRYYASRIGAAEKWTATARNTRESIEHFYQEHDMDIWRQAHYSKYNYNTKKKTLLSYHILKQAVGKDEPILDFGCGSGVLFHYLREKGFTSVDAADIPSATLDFISKWMDKSARRIINLGTDQLPKDYAAIVAVDCLEHVTEPVKIAQNLLDSLRKDGLLIVKFPKEDDFTWTHLKQAQDQRDATFELIKKHCQTIVPELIYRKH